MVKLNVNDQKRIINLLSNLPILGNERGRESVIIISGLEELRPKIDLSGSSAVAIPILVNFLCAYGRLSYDHEAIGRLLNTIKDYVGLEDNNFIDSIISNYNLMISVVNAAKVNPAAINISKEDLVEKIIGENSLRPIAFLQMGIESSKPIAYIEIDSEEGRWSGTGFLLSNDLLLTNHHVLSDKKLLSDTIFRFNYQVDKNGNPEISKNYSAKDEAEFCTNSELDYSILKLEGNPGHDWGFLVATDSMPNLNSRANIIQHPHGLPKQISIQNNYIKYVSPNKIHYITSTQPGSSGSPVFNDEWKVIALHHAGGWLYEEDESLLYFRNEGIPLTTIIDNLPSKTRLEIIN